MSTEVKLPELDEKVETILKGLANGKTREQLAEEFGNSNWKSVDMYMRRRDYSWDSQKQTYVLDVVMDIPQLKDTSKAGKVIHFLSAEGADPRDIAIRLGFKNHRDMANYMTSKGYEWHTEENNYRKKVGLLQEPTNEMQMQVASTLENLDVPEVPTMLHTFPNDFEKYLPLLQLLDENKEQLQQLLQASETNTIPRYLVPGVARTKTIQMMHTLQDLIAEFCNDRNINQRVLFEVALIDFFKKYGFEREVEMLLKN